MNSPKQVLDKLDGQLLATQVALSALIAQYPPARAAVAVELEALLARGLANADTSDAWLRGIELAKAAILEMRSLFPPHAAP